MGLGGCAIMCGGHCGWWRCLGSGLLRVQALDLTTSLPSALCAQGSGRTAIGKDLTAGMHDFALEWTSDAQGRPVKMVWLVSVR